MRPHFWIPQDATLLDDWDPDLDPNRFMSGLSHAIYELYARLRQRGVPVSIGPTVPASATVIVAFAKSMDHFAAMKLGYGHAPLVVVMGDRDHSRPLPVTPDVRVVAHPGVALRDRDIWVPLLPQRGLIERKPSRGVRISSLGFAGLEENTPAYLDRLQVELHRVGVDFMRLKPNDFDADGAQGWHDFSGIDALLCARSPSDRFPVLFKPPTKLINAWVAGCVPIVAPEPAYLALGINACNGRVLHSGDVPSILAAVQSLQEDPDLAAVFDEVRRKGAEFASRRVLAQWLDLLASVSETGRNKRWTVSISGVLSSARTRARRRWS